MNVPTTFKIIGTAWRKAGGRTGTWKVLYNKDKRVIYQLYDEDSRVLMSLVKAAENILLFANSNGKLLTGNEDFSYTLNTQ